MFKFSICLILFAIISSNAFCQNSDTLIYSGNYSVVIDSILISGNKITDRDIIIRELTVKKGDSITPKIAQYNKNRIFSLGIFTKVEVYPEKINNVNFLVIDVDESWYIYPIPFVDFKDKDWAKFSFGIDMVVQNFRGRNETLSGRVSFGYDPTYALNYNTPYLFWKESIFFSARFSYTHAKNKSQIAESLYGGEFREKYISGLIQIGKRFGLYNRLGISAGYNYVEHPKYIPGLSASNERIDRTFILGAEYTYDTRDLKQFPRDGIFTSLSIEDKGLGIDNINYQILSFDYREYRMLVKDLSLKWRFATRQTFGNSIPYYDYSFIGYSERLRGYYNYEREGTASYIGSVEMDYPILKDMNISLQFLPLIPKELLSYRIALYLELFTDTGTTTLKGEGLTFKDFYTGYGTGLTFLILPYNLFRVEYAINKFGHSEWILGLGLSF